MCNMMLGKSGRENNRMMEKMIAQSQLQDYENQFILIYAVGWCLSGD